jgi:hypothetical protein
LCATREDPQESILQHIIHPSGYFRKNAPAWARAKSALFHTILSSIDAVFKAFSTLPAVHLPGGRRQQFEAEDDGAIAPKTRKGWRGIMQLE